MAEFTLHDLQCFDAVIRTGGFQPAAALLHRSHPAVFAAVAKLERQLDLVLLDRTGYRVRPTEAGLSFHRRAQSLLRELEGLRVHGRVPIEIDVTAAGNRDIRIRLCGNLRVAAAADLDLRGLGDQVLEPPRA